MRRSIRPSGRWRAGRRGAVIGAATLVGAAALAGLVVTLGPAAPGMSEALSADSGTSASGTSASGTSAPVAALPPESYPAGNPASSGGSGEAGDPASSAVGDQARDSAGGDPSGAGFASEADGSARSGVMAAPESVSPGDMRSKSALPAPGGITSKIVPPGPGPEPGPGRDIGPSDPRSTPDRSVIRTARLTVEVRDLPGASAAVRDTVASVGGFVAAEHTVDRSSSFTLRVPSDRLDEVMGRLAGTGTVTERYGQAEDVTDQLVDVQSRVATQRASVARVRALLERANTVGEVVAVESELASREAELDSLQRRLASLNGRVTLSTLTVALNPTPVVAPAPDDGFLAGLTAGWRAFVASMGGALTVLGAVLPFAVALAVLAGGVLLGRRAVRRHRAATAALAAVAAGDARP